MWLLPLGCKISQRNCYKSAAKCQDEYPDGEKQFDVLDHQDVLMPWLLNHRLVNHWDILMHFFLPLLHIVYVMHGKDRLLSL